MRWIPCLLAACLASPAAHADDVFKDNPSRQTLKAHVFKLASNEFDGRRGPGARKAEAYIRKLLDDAGLKTQIHECPGRGEPARNVVGVLQAGETPAKEHVILSAHYDHLGRWGGFVFPGASDNAAGVAALLEIARVLGQPEIRKTLKRDVLFIAFDQEEVGLIGSHGYAKTPVRPLSECAAFATFDILGRDLADVAKGILFCVGTEHSDSLFGVVKACALPEGVALVYAGADIVGPRSDFVAFQQAAVPFLFFSTGESMDYHQPTDTPERLDYDKLFRETNALLAIARKVIAAPRAKFVEKPVARVEEAATLAGAVEQLLAEPKKLGLSKFELGLGQMFLANLRRIEKAGTMTDPDRKQIVVVCKQLIGMLQGKR